jgi:multiple sugar transport system ATP-binding protein
MATVRLSNLRKSYSGVEIIKDVTLEIEDRQFAVIVGPSGCGKSTLLRLIAGLEEITAGELWIDGKKANDIPPARRGLAMVFQSYALYPHMSVAENMGFSLKLARVPREERRNRVTEAARILQIESLLTRKPADLSGGERQRVAIGRAIVRNPKVFLFDEPLSNLDAALRVQMRLELMRLHQELNATMLYVTHDQIEAMTMADRIVVLREGAVEQVGNPLELYHHPRNLFVAGFIGTPKMNFLSATVAAVGDHCVTVRLAGGSLLKVPIRHAGLREGARVTLGVRPEHAKLVDDGPLRGSVHFVERLGGTTLLHVRTEDAGLLTVQTEGASTRQCGDCVRVELSIQNCHLFNDTGVGLPREPRIEGMVLS